MYTHLLQTLNNLPIPSHQLQHDVQAYLDEQLKRCSDLDYANYFPWRELNLPHSFFLQKVIEVNGESYLAGPRFLAGDIHKPFIQIIAGSASLTKLAADKIIAQWAALNTETLQVLKRTDEPLLGKVDQYIYLATVSDMAGKAEGECNDDDNIQVRQAAPEELDTCMSTLASGFEDMRRHRPELSDRVMPCDGNEIEEGIQAGDVYVIHDTSLCSTHSQRMASCLQRTKTSDNNNVDSATSDNSRPVQVTPAGLIYLRRDVHAFLSGYLMIEECVAPEAQGHRLAARAQIILATRIAQTEPDALLMGTIDGLNLPSQRTAARAGRSPLLRYEFITPQQLDATNP